jgi:hypothetical protein
MIMTGRDKFNRLVDNKEDRLGSSFLFLDGDAEI